ncbi:hypothetical protein HMPREF0083_01657, partial [Aneurinibacillus aneurinilyticus ATCC 12856]
PDASLFLWLPLLFLALSLPRYLIRWLHSPIQLLTYKKAHSSSS